MTRAVWSRGRGAPLVDPTGDRRAHLAARLDLVPGHRPIPTREDREEAAAVELPHRWDFPGELDAEHAVCLTCGHRGPECRDRRRAGTAAYWRLYGADHL